MLASAVLFALRHPRALPVLAKIAASVTLSRDGFFIYWSDPAFNPANTRFINNIKPDHTIHDLKEERDDKGRFKRLSGWVGQ